MLKHWLLFLLLCLGASVPSEATIVVVQHVLTTSCVATCAVTVASTGSGNTIICAGVSTSNVENDLTGCSDSSSTYVHCPNCRVFNSTIIDTADAYYTTSSTSGKTTVTCTFAGAGFGQNDCDVWEISGTSLSYDIDGSTNITAACSSCTAQGLTLTGSNDAILQVLRHNRTVTAISSPYSTFTDITGGDGFAMAINTGSGTAPTWTTNISDQGVEFGIAFKESGGGAVAPVGQIYFKKQAVNRAATYFIDTFLRPLWLPQPEIAFMNFKSRAEYIKHLLGFRKKWTLMDWKTSEGEAVFEPPVTDQQIHEYCELNR